MLVILYSWCIGNAMRCVNNIMQLYEMINNVYVYINHSLPINKRIRLFGYLAFLDGLKTALVE